jgi:8-oxo-dGTP pyrophosphatase MutT (NUDIX family)
MSQNRRTQAVVAILQRADTFLFVKRSNYNDTASGYWCPVSGRIEKGETQPDALKREVMEEVWLAVVATKKICEIISPGDQFVLHYWQTEIVGGEVRIASDEATDLKWFTLEEIKRLRAAFEEDVQIIERLVKF